MTDNASTDAGMGSPRWSLPRGRVLQRALRHQPTAEYLIYVPADAAEQPPVLDWDPEQNFQAIGDFIDFAVSEYGTDVLVETDGARWSEIEAEWRVALRADLTGRTTPTTEWVVGIAIVTVLLVVATTAIGLGLWSKHRRRERPDTAPAIPGFFSDS